MSKLEKKKPISLYIQNRLFEELKNYCKQNDESVSAFMVLLIRNSWTQVKKNKLTIGINNDA